MGGTLGTQSVDSMDESGDRGTKRKHDDTDEDNDFKLLNTPKKRKFSKTSKYIYNRLFVNGENSDINIVALGKTWKLHKVYLSQAHYFQSMFSGNWKDSRQSSINIDIQDPNIDSAALNTAFSSLYKDDISLKPTEVIPVFAVATLLGIDELAAQSISIMKDTMSCSTVTTYYQASCLYSVPDLRDSCMDWFENNLLTLQTPALLADIDVEAMKNIVKSANLVVIQIEMDVYMMLKKWMFLQLHTSLDDFTNLLEKADSFFHEHKVNQSTEFLMTLQGYKFIHVFAQLRFQYIINDLNALNCLKDDNIVPSAWILSTVYNQWNRMLKLEQGLDTGPSTDDIEKFSATCERVGRVLILESPYCWRWTGYAYGIDLLISYSARTFTMTRNMNREGYSGSHSAQKKRSLIYKFTVSNLNGHGQKMFSKSTELKHQEMEADQDIMLFTIGRQCKFPLHICANFLVFDPSQIDPVEIPELKLAPEVPVMNISSSKLASLTQSSVQTETELMADSYLSDRCREEHKSEPLEASASNKEMQEEPVITEEQRTTDQQPSGSKEPALSEEQRKMDQQPSGSKEPALSGEHVTKNQQPSGSKEPNSNHFSFTQTCFTAGMPSGKVSPITTHHPKSTNHTASDELNDYNQSCVTKRRSSLFPSHPEETSSRPVPTVCNPDEEQQASGSEQHSLEEDDEAPPDKTV